MEQKISTELNTLSFKLVIPEAVERKIRHLCTRIHDVEWSGILFYRPSGTIEEGNFQIDCVDILVMDIGNVAYTEYEYNSPDIIAYTVSHPELMEDGIQEGLVHSHNNMSAFFSGTDMSTLAAEGEKRSHFLSLIVNNTGPYVARFTRKIEGTEEKSICTTTKTTSYYKTFDSVTIPLLNEEIKTENTSETKTLCKVEYFDLQIERHNVPNLFEDVDSRLSLIKSSKETKAIPTVIPTKEVKAQTLFNDEDYIDFSNTYKGKEDASYMDYLDDFPTLYGEKFNSSLIKTLATRLLFGSLFVNPDVLKIEQFIPIMDKRYETIFGKLVDKNPNEEVKENQDRFKQWIDTLIEFLIYTEDRDLLAKLNKEVLSDKYKFDVNDTAAICARDLYEYLAPKAGDSWCANTIIKELEDYL